jgi:23S rRNA G2445 N2-methylase RlmL
MAPPCATSSLPRHLVALSRRLLASPIHARSIATHAGGGWGPGGGSSGSGGRSNKNNNNNNGRADRPAWGSPGDWPGPSSGRRPTGSGRREEPGVWGAPDGGRGSRRMDDSGRGPPTRPPSSSSPSWDDRSPPRRPVPRAPPLPPLPPGTFEYFATCHPGNEVHLAAELAGPRIKAANVRPGRSGVAFTSPPGEAGSAVMHRANLWSRVGIRVLHVLARGSIAPPRNAWGGGDRGGDRLYLFARRAVNWPALLPPGGTLTVDARLGDVTDIATPALACARVRDAVCDAIRDATGARPPPPPPPPPGLPLAATVDLPLLIAADGTDAVTLYRDTSGASLHKRGYRAGGAVHAAALNEAAAAGVLAAAGWAAAAARAGSAAASTTPSSSSHSEPPIVLADPMCGSGTLLIEAALAATQAAPGLFRRTAWPFERWPDHDPRSWAAAKGAAARARVAWEGGVLLGNDTHRPALDLAMRDADRAGVGHMISWSCGPAGGWAPECRPNMVVTNPPWGRRLGGMDSEGRSARAADHGSRRPYADADGELDWDGGGSGASAGQRQEAPGADDLAAAWADLGAFLRSSAAPSTAWVVCGNPAATRALRMRAASKAPLGIGGADARLLRYEVLPPLPPGGGVLNGEGVRVRAGEAAAGL